MIDFTPKHHRPRQPLAPTPAALREDKGAANSFEMTLIRRKEEDREKREGEEEEREDSLAVSVVPCSSSAAKTPTAAAAPIEQRRLEAQRHRHAAVWTKDPHGGRHRPVRERG